MKSSTLILFLLTLLSPVIAQSEIDSCGGSIFNNYCCVNGGFSGPVVSSFSASFSSRDSSRSASFSSRDSSRFASLSSRSEAHESPQGNGGIRTTDAAQVTARAILSVQKRAITTEVSPGLTCIGDSARSLTGLDNNGSGGSGGGTSTPVSGSGTGATVIGTSTSSSRAGGAVITKEPVLVAGAAAAFAYGAM